MEHRLARTAAAACALLALSANAAAQEKVSTDVLRYYDASSQAPDYVVFRSYLRQINAHDEQGGDEDGVHFVQETMRLDHDDAGYRRASELHTLLIARHRLLAADIDQAENEMLCGESRRTRSEADVYAIIDRLPGIREKIAEKHYLETITTVDSDTAQKLDATIQQSKKDFSSTRFSARSMFGDAGVDVIDHVEKLCLKHDDKE